MEQPPNEKQEGTEPEVTQPGNEEAPDEGTPPTALEAAATVMSALKNDDMSSLASWVSPEKGLRFSPYAYVDLKKDLLFSRDEVEGLMEDSTVHVWRTFPGNGDLIEMPYAEYHQQFVYDANFKEDAEIALNQTLGESTMLSNLNEVYPKESHGFVEYYISGRHNCFILSSAE